MKKYHVHFPDKFTTSVFLLTSIALLLPSPPETLTLFPLIIAACLEEILFRWGLHDYLLTIPCLQRKILGKTLSAANLATSVSFALLHLVYHPAFWALATLFPSLLLGKLWERRHSLWLCIALHLCYNLGYYYL